LAERIRDQQGGVGKIQPASFHDAPTIVQPHIPFQNLSEQELALVRANGDEIRAGLGVVVAF